MANKRDEQRRKLQPLVGRQVLHNAAIYGRPIRTEERKVTLMAMSGNYAMVRRKGAIPYVCDIDELLPNDEFRGGCKPSSGTSCSALDRTGEEG